MDGHPALRDAMLFASLISSTDPVTTLSIFSDMGMDPDLHAGRLRVYPLNGENHFNYLKPF